ncbi:NAD(P)H-dependent oxidoreductase [Pelagibacterium xiamenense]|uniref:NAD(P)H-dependent oxidoreductase n=1 Tax=Pelagibacterium xiamenense TaxID=2901140 RepID=UPI001E51829D|nr:NAD(P)H-dependent oxidoreductase [Pelagibacterium xiamenense]MCD7061321.1 NAD(P)H-dependent oxidoreductase [Pelagibacterium xiamenense]
MHALIVLAHPEEKSFNAQLAADAREALTAMGYTVETADLYRDGFDPLEDARHFSSRADNAFFSAMIEQRHASDTGTLPTDVESAIVKLERADLVVFQFPLWWWSVPAILKGWFDRVFAWGRVYSSGKRYPDRGHFKGKRALVSVTTGAPGLAFGPNGRAGDLDLILWPIHFGLAYVGFSVLPHFASFEVVKGPNTDPDTLRTRLDGYKAGLRAHLGAIETLEPLKFNTTADWDETGRLRPTAPSYSPFIRHVA